MRLIIYTRADGGVAVVTPVINTFPVPEQITEAEAEQRAFAMLPPSAINPQFVDPAAIPADRSKRRAWRRNGGGGVVVDSAVVSALRDSDAAAAIDGIDLLQFEHLFLLENEKRDIKAKLNQLLPGTYPPADVAQITRAQYRTALINRWKTLNP
jgi:hypothetical protein